MHQVIDFAAGGYRFLRGDSLLYSLAVAALPGYRLERVRFRSPPPLEQGFARVAEILAAAGRPPAALAAFELRSPAPFDEAGFAALSRRYLDLIRASGFPGLTDVNPIGRTNVCPVASDLAEVSVHAFAYTLRDAAAPPSFLIAGALDLLPGEGPLADLVVAPGQVDAAGLRAKARHALADLDGRLAALGYDWSMTTGSNVYCRHDALRILIAEMTARGAVAPGITWHPCDPPIQGLDFEMDARCVPLERVL